MCEQDPFIDKRPPLARLRMRYPVAYDIVTMLIYAFVAYGWGLWVYPQGRDFAVLASGAQGQTWLLRWVFGTEVAMFGTALHAYHLFNVVLVYSCMVCILFIVKFALKGPWWLGTLAAVLFMANPVHTESLMNLCGAVDLLPCLFALLAIAAYLGCAIRKAWWTHPPAWALFALALAASPANASLLLVLVLAETLLMDTTQRDWRRLAPCAIMTAVALWFHRSELLPNGFDPARAFAPLYFIFYPIGFLPESARRFHENPWLGWVAAAAVAFVAFLICRKARRPAIVFGLLAMPAVRIFGAGNTVDPVHLVGGGSLLLANAFFALALTGLFYRMMDHPRWRRTIVSFTTLLCVLFFAMQIKAVHKWRASSEIVQTFQARVAEFVERNPGEPMGVCPDFGYYSGAPVRLSDSMSHDTLFSKAAPLVPLFQMNMPTSPGRFSVERWSADEGIVRLGGASLLDVAPWPYALSRKGARVATGSVEVEVLEAEGLTATFRVVPLQGKLPTLIAPGVLDQTEQSGEENPGQ